MTVMEQERTCLLGGQSTSRGLFGHFTTTQFLAVMAVSCFWVAVLFITRSLIPAIAGAATVGVLIWLLGKRTDAGDPWTSRLVTRLWFGVTIGGVRPFKRSAAADWSPAEPGQVPPVVGPFRELVDVPEDGAGAPVAVLHQGDRKGSFLDDSFLTAVIEMRGAGDGLRPIPEVNRQGEKFGLLLRGQASTESPVEQLDLETRVLATSPEMTRQATLAQVVDDCPPALRESMEQLADLSAHSTETYRTFMTVRFNNGALSERMRRRGGATPGVDVDVLRMEAVLEELRKVIARVERAGYEVRGVLGPRRVAAMIRHLYVPSYPLDDMVGLTSIGDGWQHPYRVRPRAVVVDGGPAGEWWHAVASVPYDAWPTTPEGTRWLESLVTDVPRAVIRTVKAQHALLSRRDVRDEMKLSLLYDSAAIAATDKKGQISTGEDEVQASAARRVLDDVVHGKSAGDRPALRIIVSAESEEDLEDARALLSDQAEDRAGVARLVWHDWRHHQAMLLAAPLGRGVIRR